MATMPREESGVQKNKSIRLPKRRRKRTRTPLFWHLSTELLKISLRRMRKQLKSKLSNKLTSMWILDKVPTICLKTQSSRTNIS